MKKPAGGGGVIGRNSLPHLNPGGAFLLDFSARRGLARTKILFDCWLVPNGTRTNPMPEISNRHGGRIVRSAAVCLGHSSEGRTDNRSPPSGEADHRRSLQDR